MYWLWLNRPIISMGLLIMHLNLNLYDKSKITWKIPWCMWIIILHENSHVALEIEDSKDLEHPWEIWYSIGYLWGISFPRGSQFSDGDLDFQNLMYFPMGVAYLPLEKRCEYVTSLPSITPNFLSKRGCLQETRTQYNEFWPGYISLLSQWW